MPRKPKKPTCEDCYFQRNMLCALELDEPCATFRPNRPEGLVPPKQPVLLMRPPRWASAQAGAALNAPDSVQPEVLRFSVMPERDLYAWARTT